MEVHLDDAEGMRDRHCTSRRADRNRGEHRMRSQPTPWSLANALDQNRDMFVPITLLRLRRPLPLCGPRCGSSGPCMDAHILFHRRLMMGQNQDGGERGHNSSDQEAAFGTNGSHHHRADGSIGF